MKPFLNKWGFPIFMFLLGIGLELVPVKSETKDIVVPLLFVPLILTGLLSIRK